jgi:cyanophycin synthetase
MRKELDDYVPNFVISDRIEIAECTFRKDLEIWKAKLIGSDLSSCLQLDEKFQLLDDQDRDYIITTLFLFLFLLEILKIPVFKLKSTVVNSDENSFTRKRYFCEIKIENIDFLPKRLFEIIWRHAKNTSLYISQNACTTSNVEHLQNLIQREIVTPLRSMVPGGKSTFPILQAANQLDIPFLHLGRGIYQLGHGSKSHVFDRSYSEKNSTFGTLLAQSKFATTNLIRSAGFPTPQNFLASTLIEAKAAASKLGFPVVVKPVDRDRGEGVTINIGTDFALKNAFTVAVQLSQSKRVLVEKMAVGVCHRIFISHNKMLYAVKRMPIGVYGDGIKTISEIVREEISFEASKAPWLRRRLPTLDEEALNSLSALGLGPNSVPEIGKFLPLRAIESTADGGIDIEVTDQVHKDNLEAATQISRLFGLSEVGIDFISENISDPWYMNGGVFNEVNVAPLLGGGPISRGYIPKFLRNYFSDNGRIPIEIEFDIDNARLKQIALIKQSYRTYLVGESECLNPELSYFHLLQDKLAERVRSVLYRKDCEAIVIYDGKA